MLELFRRYQKYIYWVVTAIIVLSFTLTGAPNALNQVSNLEKIAFNSIDGTPVFQHELDSMVLFIASDGEDSRLSGSAWGGNFLNDGVIKRDFLETGLAQLLITTYPEVMNKDLQPRLEKEKRFIPYTHPTAPFLTAEAVWNYVNPSINKHLSFLKQADKAITPEALEARIALYLEEGRFPAPALRQILLSQQQRYQQVLAPDQNLNYLDLSLFGYHHLEDWFGSNFLKLISQTIINTSKLAEEAGYQVTTTEAFADLMRNAEANFQLNKKLQDLGVSNSADYMKEMLRRMNLDQNGAIKIWQQVLLARRLLKDVGSSLAIDPLVFKQFIGYSKAKLNGDLYTMSPDLSLNRYRDLQKFELYLDKVAKRGEDKIVLPSKFFSLNEIKEKNPELIQKVYQLEVAEVDKGSIQAQIPLKEIWKWQSNIENWEKLKKKFPELGLEVANTSDERFALLEKLDNQTRARLDAFSRSQMIGADPEIIVRMLKNAPVKKIEARISKIGGNIFVSGLENRTEFMQLLDKAPLIGSMNLTEEESIVAAKLEKFTADNKKYYRISLIERAGNEQIRTFAEANQDGILDSLLDKQLETHYVKIRDKHGDIFKKEDHSWKPFADVKELVADYYFEKILKALQEQGKILGKKGKELSKDQLAFLRFYDHLETNRKKILDGKQELGSIMEEKDFVQFGLNKRDLKDQWKIFRRSLATNRSQKTKEVDYSALFMMKEEEISKIQFPVNHDPYFFQLKKLESGEDAETLTDQVMEAHRLLSNEAQRLYMEKILENFKAKKAISFE